MMDKKAFAVFLAFCLSCLSCLVLASDLPAGIQKCSIMDENCLRDGMNYVLKNFARKGIKELNLVQLDPLLIKKFSLGKNPKSPVNIDLTFTNANLLGLSDAQVKKVTPFSKDLSRDITFELMSPRITLTGPYVVDGKVLILPIRGKGDADIVLQQCKVHAVVKLRPVSKGPHQTFAEVVEVKFFLDPSRVTYKFTGLFNGEKAPSENFHALVNESWQEVFNELKADISTAMGLIFKSILNRTLSKLPLEQLFSGV
ncbi:protein takeout [Drosophila sulfurigaster albostrigata]|uniref:protein takeout n=1 Tax=Drosophila sulfurigaster albostrigata TaxID=89887 RepID=UPI002D219320|nr:protein takeout [Drosophila sulfurigaster albostrigata]